METVEPSEGVSLERVPTIRSTLRIIRIIAVIESSAKFGITEDFIGFVDHGHLFFTSAFIGMGVLGGVPAVEKERKVKHGAGVKRDKGETYYARFLREGEFVPQKKRTFEHLKPSIAPATDEEYMNYDLLVSVPSVTARF